LKKEQTHLARSTELQKKLEVEAENPRKMEVSKDGSVKRWRHSEMFA